MNDLIKNSGKNNQVQFLRAVFCLCIIFYHYTYRYGQIYGQISVFNNEAFGFFASFGVFSFFILSGFFLLRRNELCSFKEKIAYWIRRFLNLYVLYLIAIIIIYLFSLTGLYGEDRTVSFLGFVQNCFFVNVITGCGYVDGAHWYVFALLCLYLVAFVYDLLPKKITSEKGYFYWVVVLVVAITSLVCVKFFADKMGFATKGFIALNLFLCQGYFPYVFIGLSLFFFDYANLKCKKNIMLIVSCVVTLAYVTIEDWVYLLIVLISLVLILLSLFRKMEFLEKAKPMVLLGNASYSVYLLHQNIGYMLIILFSKIINYYVAFVLVTILILAIGILFFFFVETNIKKLISKAFRTNPQGQIEKSS